MSVGADNLLANVPDDQDHGVAGLHAGRPHGVPDGHAGGLPGLPLVSRPQAAEADHQAQE